MNNNKPKAIPASSNSQKSPALSFATGTIYTPRNEPARTIPIRRFFDKSRRCVAAFRLRDHASASARPSQDSGYPGATTHPARHALPAHAACHNALPATPSRTAIAVTTGGMDCAHQLAG